VRESMSQSELSKQLHMPFARCAKVKPAYPGPESCGPNHKQVLFYRMLYTKCDALFLNQNHDINVKPICCIDYITTCICSNILHSKITVFIEDSY
jgi:hypothetical protein